MNSASLALFLENKAEFDWRNGKLVCWIYYTDMLEFTNLTGSYLDEKGMEAIIQKTQIAFEIDDLLEYADINPEDLCEKD
jgi:hypothetical protein